MDKNKRRAILVVLVSLLAAVAAGAMYLTLSTKAQPPQAQAAPPVATPPPGVEVLVASRDIEPNTILTTSYIVTASYPSALVPADTYTNAVEVVGSTAKTKVFGGQMLLKRQFLAGNGQVGASINVPTGKVLVAFPSTDILNSTGAVQPGDHVDILLSLPISGTTRLDGGAVSSSQLEGGKTLVAQTTLQNIIVYNSGMWTPPGESGSDQKSDKEAAASIKIITLLVDHQEAVILKYVKDSGGIIDLAVRSLEEDQVATTDPVNIDYLVDLYRFIGLPKK